MKLKKFALRGLIALVVAVALCMFFARTVQTITTPKVQLVTASSGRYEEKMTFTAQVYFPETESIVVEEARDLGVVVKRVYVREGQRVKAGDVIFTAGAGDTETKLAELRKEYDAKQAELTKLDLDNRTASRESRQNDLYNAMLDAQDQMTDDMFAARMQAVTEGITLTDDVSTWNQQLTLSGIRPSAELTAAVSRAVASRSACDAAREAFYTLMEDRKMRVKDEVFAYIRDRDALIETMAELSAEMVELAARSAAVEEVRAPRDGWITAVGVQEGEAYDGIKAAYAMNGEDAAPVLRAPLESVSRAIEDGTKAEIVSDVYGTERTTVDKTTLGSDGSRYLQLAMPESYLAEDSSAIRRVVADGGVKVTISYRAKQSTTLLPASAVRSEGEGQDYVYLIERSWGGFMSQSGMKVKKTTVTVLERGDKTVSIAEDLSWQEVADREDRALEDGQTVMEYVD
ncbi:MAG: biotin/lipoyl-binding protein [Aristaeellaceae bacterium]